MEYIEVVALILLVLRLVTVGVLIYVLITQIKMYKTTDTDFPFVRTTLSVMVAIGLLGCILPISIDVATLLGKSYAGRLLVPYAFSNALTVLNMAVGFVVLYHHVASQRITLSPKEKRGRAKDLRDKGV